MHTSSVKVKDQQQQLASSSSKRCLDGSRWCSSSSWIVTIVWPGLGLLGESYVVFSLGTVPPLLASTAATTSLPSTSAAVLLTGIVLGMLTMGTAASFWGRRRGSIGTAVCMCVGSVGIWWWGSSNTNTITSLLLSTSVFLLGLGVGGEYPMAAASASEKQQSANNDGIASTTATSTGWTRGQQIQLVFSMQGMGILLNCCVLWFLLVVLRMDNADNDNAAVASSNARKVQWLWRILYGIGVLLLGTLLVTRILHLKESQVWEQDRKQQQMKQATASSSTNNLGEAMMTSPNCSGGVCVNEDDDDDDRSAAPSTMDGIQLCPTVSSLSSPSVVLKDVFQQQQMRDRESSRSSPSQATSTPTELFLERRAPTPPHQTLWLAWELYGIRLVGVSLSWFLWDVAFYGNKLFQSAFLYALLLDDETTSTTLPLTHMAAAATVNAAVAASGYLCAAAIVDRVGRRTLQLSGFGLTGLLFVLTGVGLDVAWPNSVLLILYLGTSFLGQVGPNATTFLVPAEVFPTALRTTVHGIAAASGKLGALAASLVFTRMLAASAVSMEDDGDDASTGNATSKSDLFLYSGYASLLGAVVTYWTIPDATYVPLQTLDRQWRQAVDHGRIYAIPTCLSVYERTQWERKQQARTGEFLTSDVHNAVYA